MNANCPCRCTAAVLAGLLVLSARGYAETFQEWLNRDREALRKFPSGQPAKEPSRDNPPGTPPQAGADAEYSYYYAGRLVSLQPSARYVAAHGLTARLRANEAALAAAGFAVDLLSSHPTLRQSDVLLLRASGTQPTARDRTNLLRSAVPLLERVLSVRTGQVDARPVFERGDVLLIPCEEVIVGFKSGLSSAQARGALEPLALELGVVDVQPCAGQAFVVRLRSGAGATSFAASRALVRLPAVEYAEPNPLFVLVDRRPVEQMGAAKMPEAIRQALVDRARSNRTVTPPRGGSGTWVTIDSLDAESESGVPEGWTAGPWFEVSDGPGGIPTEFTKAYWGATDRRSHKGARSLYCAAAGEDGVVPPGPAPLSTRTALLTPFYDLSAYEHVYVDFWYYAVNEYAVTNWVDFGFYRVWNPSTGATPQAPTVIGDLSDTSALCPADPTTDRGWRHALIAVPPHYIQNPPTGFLFVYQSNKANPTEGLYIDDLRIVGCADVDAQALGDDTYGARLYPMRNTGQIAGMGTDDNDLHLPEAWAETAVSTNLIVAMIDDGVELTHPDLNMVRWLDAGGSPGGGPLGDGARHGTAVAGLIGAIRNNGQGVIGAAPGVRIMSLTPGARLIDVSSAIDRAVESGARVLNMSFGEVGASSANMTAAIARAIRRGCVVVCGAGNGPDRPPYNYTVMFPASLTETMDVIAVGASSLTDEYKGTASSDGGGDWGSSYVGSGPDVVAPGTWLYTTDRTGMLGYSLGGGYTTADYTSTFDGTSGSAPLVAGVCALMLSAQPNLTPADVKRILRETADDIDAPGFDDRTGAGRVNALRAVRAARSALPVLRVDPPSVSFKRGDAGRAVKVCNDGNADLVVHGFIWSAPWLNAKLPERFLVPPRSSVAVDLSVDWAKVPADGVRGSIAVSANDAARPSVDVPVSAGTP